MNDMKCTIKCPICGEVLQKYGEVDPDASRSSVWQELIRTRKALGIAKDAIDVISLKYHKDTPSIFLIKYAENAKAEITALEQKDVK